MVYEEPYYVTESKNRAQVAGIDLSAIPVLRTRRSEHELAQRQRDYAEVLSVGQYFAAKLFHQMRGIPFMVAITDEVGLVLQVFGDAAIQRTMDELGIGLGMQFTEEDFGPNAVNIALLERTPVRLIGRDHYQEHLHDLACYSVPLKNHMDGTVIGTVSIMTAAQLSHPTYLTILIMTVDAIERELVLRKRNAELDVLNQVILNTSPCGVIITDTRGQVSMVNSFVEKMTGISRNSMLNQPTKDMPVVGSYMDTVIKRGEVYHNVELDFQNPLTHYHHVCLFDALPIRDKDNHVIGAYGQLRDITERKCQTLQLQHANILLRESFDHLQEGENQLRTLINALPSLIVLKDRRGRWLEANDTALNFFGITAEGYKGKTNEQLSRDSVVSGEFWEVVQKTDEETWRSASTNRFENSYVRPDGTTLTFEVTKGPIFDSIGELNGTVVVARDITERRQTEEMLRRTEKLAIVGQLAAGVTHEIRNPLTALKGFLKLISTSDNPQKFIDIMENELNRIEAVTNEMLLLAKPRARNFRMIDMKQRLIEVIQLLSTEAIMRSVEIVFSADNNVHSVECDASDMEQLFINVVRNAIDATPDSGKIVIESTQQEDEIVVRVRDSGIGIPGDVVKRLGTPFYTTKEHGTGLGLMICQKIIAQHGGRLAIDSEVGQGTTVTIALPCRQSVEGSA